MTTEDEMITGGMLGEGVLMMESETTMYTKIEGEVVVMRTTLCTMMANEIGGTVVLMATVTVAIADGMQEATDLLEVLPGIWTTQGTHTSDGHGKSFKAWFWQICHAAQAIKDS